MTETVDLAIIGGGMVGASLACALADLPLRVALVEAVPFDDRAQPSYDERTTALSHGTRRIYSGLGLWDELAPSGCPIRHIHVSERGRFGVTRIDADEQGVPALGYVTPNRAIGRVLNRRLADASNVELICPGRLQRLNRRGEAVDIEVTDGGGHHRRLTARLVVGADGARSAVRRALGLAIHTVDYGQSALITNVTPDRPRPGTAFERFCGDRVVALLPVDEARYALVWTLPKERVDEMLGLPETEFCAALSADFGQRLGRFVRAGERYAYPLERLMVERDVSGRVVLIGNAAHSLHPVAGQGFNLGLRDVAMLADVLADAVAAAEDVGADAVLARYSQARRADQRRVSRFTNDLIHLFRSRLPGIGTARSLGMLGLDLMPGAKRALARRTMGADDASSRLARGLALTEVRNG